MSYESIQLVSDEVDVDEETGMVVYMGMEYTPDQARELADQLNGAADTADEIREELAQEAPHEVLDV